MRRYLIVSSILSFLCQLNSVPGHCETRPAMASNLRRGQGDLSKKTDVVAASQRLSVVCEHLSKDSGLTITADTAVASHIVSLVIKGQTMRETLNAIAEVTGLVWSQDKSGAVNIGRKPATVTRQLATSVKSLRSALPLDIRDFLQLPPPPRLPNGNNAAVGNVAPGNAGQKPPPKTQVIARAIEQDRNAILAEMRDATSGGKAVPVKDLRPEILERIVRIILLDAVGQSPKLFTDLPAPYQLNPMSAVLVCGSGGQFLIGSHWQDQNRDHYKGFGMNVLLPERR